MTSKISVQYGKIWWVALGTSVGHEYKGRRPALVIQSNKQLQKSNLITVMPLTSNIKNRIEGDIFIRKDNRNNLFSDSILKVRDIISFDYSRFIKKIGIADDKVLVAVKAYLKEHFGII